MNTNTYTILSMFCLSLFGGILISCSSTKVETTDTVYYSKNDSIKDRNNTTVLVNNNGSLVKELDISKDKSIKINQDLEIFRLTHDCFLYTAWADMGRWGRIGSNGLVLINNGKALLIDSPTLESQTIELAWWLDKNLDVRFDSFVPGHWHDDCVGGMAWLNRNGVKTYANHLTNSILLSKRSEQAKESFSDSLMLDVEGLKVEVHYLGGGHSTDNIVVWIPSQKILFGGCMIKDSNSTSIGNTSDAAPLNEWLKTIRRVKEKFPKAQMIIPGHGQHGSKELFEHTKRIIEKELQKTPKQ